MAPSEGAQQGRPVMTLREWRERRDLTQEQLAARCGLSVSTIRDVERSAERSAARSGEGSSTQRTFRARTRRAIAMVLEVSQIEIVEFRYRLAGGVLVPEQSIVTGVVTRVTAVTGEVFIGEREAEDAPPRSTA